MANRRLTWELPVVTPRQAAIKHVEISFRADASFPWTKQADVPVDDPQELLFVDVAPGTMYYRAIIVDVENIAGSPVEGSATAAFDPPGTVMNFTITEE